MCQYIAYLSLSRSFYGLEPFITKASIIADHINSNKPSFIEDP